MYETINYWLIYSLVTNYVRKYINKRKIAEGLFGGRIKKDGTETVGIKVCFVPQDLNFQQSLCYWYTIINQPFF